MMIFTIAWRELRQMFLSPLAWCVLAVIQAILAWSYLITVEASLRPAEAGNLAQYGVTAIALGVFGQASFLLLLVVPLMSMRLIAEERRSGALSLLMSAPLSMTEIVLGKYLGLLMFLFIMLALITLMPLALALGTHLDYGHLFAGMLGLALELGAFAAVGLYMSTLTRQPVIAAISGFGILLGLWIINASTTGGTGTSAVFHYLSLLDHYRSLILGVFDSSDVIYYLLFITTFLVLSIRRLDSFRLQH
ncbi:MAG: ABC transporter permease [Gammaproteobacteria bacterium]